MRHFPAFLSALVDYEECWSSSESRAEETAQMLQRLAHNAVASQPSLDTSFDWTPNIVDDVFDDAEVQHIKKTEK
jgi:hypothetical protein